MDRKNNNSITAHQFIDYALVVLCFFGIVGFALGFTKWFDYSGIGLTWVNLPVFPNILDSAFLICSASYLTWRVIKK
jgi:hypothetical protein